MRLPPRVDAEAQGCGMAFERCDAAFALLGLVTALPLIDEGLAAGAHEEHHPRRHLAGADLGGRT